MEHYLSIEKSLQTEQSLLQSKKNKLSSLRLFLFIIAATCFVYYATSSNTIALLGSLVFFILLMIYVVKSTKVTQQLLYTTQALTVIEEIKQEEKEDTFSELNKEFQHHIYQKDLDILEGKSLFNRINKTQTRLGNLQLKKELTHLILDQSTIKERQQSFHEMEEKSAWNVKYLTLAQRIHVNQNTSFWFNEAIFKQAKIKYLPILYAAINICIFVWLCVEGFPKKKVFFWVVGAVFFSFLFNLIFKNKIAQVLSYTNMKGTELENLVQLFQHIENEDFKTKYVDQLKSKFIVNGEKASALLQSLASTKETLDASQFPMVGFILNTMFLWRLYYVIQFEQEIQKTVHHINPWLQHVAEFETIISWAIFNTKHPSFTTPIVSDQPFEFKIKQAFHPLLDESIAVKNDFETHRPNNITIITGANMAGKSTFLRTIGTNLVLAMNGAHVSAEAFVFYPMNLFTSIRTVDNLASGDSYFKNEINKLKILIDLLAEGQPQFIILDEILKGTNSQDKLIGSEKFLEKLKDYPTPLICFIATHDLELTKMEEKYPSHLVNYCFELKNVNNNFFSDYKLRKGTTQVMNAIFLMKQFQIID